MFIFELIGRLIYGPNYAKLSKRANHKKIKRKKR